MYLPLFLSCLFIISITLVIANQSAVFSDYPKGYDFFDHASVIKIIRDNFPHILWNPYWDFGTVLFPHNYPSLYHFILALLSRIFPLELPRLMMDVAVLNIVLTVISIYGIIYLLAKKHLPALIGAVFYLSASSVWAYVLTEGFYSRNFAQMTLAFALLAFILYFRRVEIQGQRSIRHAEFILRQAQDGERSRTISASGGILKPFVRQLTDQGGQVQDDKQTGEGGWPYYLVIFSFALVFLSHLLTTALLIFTFLLLTLLLFPRWDRRLSLMVKVLFPVFGVISFYYLPILFWGIEEQGLIGIFYREHHSPLSFSQLFRQSYPGLPFLSLPLFLLLILTVWLTKEKSQPQEKQVTKIFWGFGALVSFTPLYLLGVWGRPLSDFDSAQLLTPAVLFLAVFIGLGFYLLVNYKILNSRVLFVILAGLGALSIFQTTQFKKGIVDQGGIWPKLILGAPDKTRLFRFAHRNEVLDGLLNYYSPMLQTGGYGETGGLFSGYRLWFNEEVFGRVDNLSQTEFFLNWYGIKTIYEKKPAGDRRVVANNKITPLELKLLNGRFSRVTDSEWLYNNASPILLATNTPVVTVTAGNEEYQKILAGLAEGYRVSQTIIPLRVAGSEVLWDGISRVSSWPEMKELLEKMNKNSLEVKFSNAQKAKFINSQRREIELNEKFKGVLLKESYFRNWHAWLEPMTKGQRLKTDLKIYQAGPGVMYVFLPAGYSTPANVVFEYQQSLIEKIGILISFVTFILVILSWFRIDWGGRITLLLKVGRGKLFYPSLIRFKKSKKHIRIFKYKFRTFVIPYLIRNPRK